MNRKTKKFIVFAHCLVFLALIILLLPSIVTAATERRTALVIGNGSYAEGRLRNPVNDATDVAATLKDLGFSVSLLKNANRRQMDDAMRSFGYNLRQGGVGLFYFAGHGIQVEGINYLVPIGSRIEKEEDVSHEAIDAGRVLGEMSHARNSMNIVILDACRNNPYARGFRSESRGLAMISRVPKGAFISYATAPGEVAMDGSDRNSPYTKALLESIVLPGQPIELVFKKVRQKLDTETGGKQVPWDSSSLRDEFYFVPPSNLTVSTSAKAAEEKKPAAETAVVESTPKPQTAKKITKVKIAKQPVEEPVAAYPPASATTTRQDYSMAHPPASPTAERTGCIENDGRFCKYSDGTVLDKHTKLMWAARDNGADINWHDAKSYCENYRGGGYTDWRLPTQEELARLHNSSLRGYPQDCGSQHSWVKLTDLIHLTCCCQWTSETRGSTAAIFSFQGGSLRDWNQQSNIERRRVLPVRSVKNASFTPAQSTIVIAEGNGCMEDYKSVKEAEKEAMVNAKRNAIEIALSDLKSQTKANESPVEIKIDNFTDSTINVIQELERTWFNDANLGKCCRMKIKAAVILKFK